MPTRKFKRRQRKTRKSKGGLFGFINPYKTWTQNRQDWERIWQHKLDKNGKHLYPWEETTYWPGGTNSRMEPVPNKGPKPKTDTEIRNSKKLKETQQFDLYSF